MKERKQIAVLVDYSGSMAEMGRLRLISRLCKQVREFLTTWEFNNEPDIYYLTKEGLLKDAAKPPCGSLNFTDSGVSIRREIQENAAVLFIGDGNYSRTDVSRIESILARKRVRCVAVHVGAGCDLPTLKRLIGRAGKLYAPEDIWQAMAFLLLSETKPAEVISEAETEDDSWDS